MAHIAFDLDAKKKVGPAARSAGVDPGTIAWGLLELWEHAWATGTDMVSELVLDGCFGPSPRTREVLIAYDFIEEVDGAFRVRGARRYLRITEARRKGAQATNAKKKSRSSDAQATLKRRSEDGLHRTPNTEQRSPSSETTGRASRVVSDSPPGFLRDGIDAAFLELRQAPYAWSFEDERAIGALLGKGSEDEILRRWRVALETRFPRCLGIRDLLRHWNAYATAEAAPPPKPKDVTRGRVAAEEVPPEAHEVPREIEF